MKFSEVSVGQKFVFDFDKSVKDESYYYSYEKVAKNRVKCLSCPKTENSIGVISPFTCFYEDSICHLFEEKKEEKEMGYIVTSNGMSIGTAYDKETLTSLVRYVYLSCYVSHMLEESNYEQKGLEIEFCGFSTSYSFIEYTVYEIVEQYFD